ncbi:MAG: hypothetical protein ING19_00760 [Azospirillum sp.]|nr:hypothetical protein [Azospirillum sp.]
MFENFEIKFRALAEEFASSRLPDDDEDRCHVYDTPMWRILLFAHMGPPLDPYTAAAVARAVDRVAMMIPGSAWLGDAIRVSATYHAQSPFRGIDNLSRCQAHFYARRVEDVAATIKTASRTIADKFRVEIGKALPPSTTMDPRIVRANILPFLPGEGAENSISTQRPVKPPRSVLERSDDDAD